MTLHHISRNKLDVSKWDRCISRSFNGIIYAYSWYLDIVCTGWEALVLDDYEAVMPLTISEKYNIPYIFQPFLTQQLGIFTFKKLNADLVNTFLDAIPDKYKYVEINLNKFNKVSNNEIINKQNTTYELDLIKTYDKLYLQFSTNAKRNVNKAKDYHLSIKKGILPNEFVNFKETNLTENESMKDNQADILKRLISFTTSYKFGETYGIYTDDGNLCAAAFFVMSHYKAIFLSAASSAEGKDKSAMFLLVDHFIKSYSERNLTLDFEGSNLEGVARFYAGFGAKPCVYTSIKINKLPWYIKLLKQ